MKASLALFILCVSVLGVFSYTPYKEFDPFPFTSNSTCPAYSGNWVNALKGALQVFDLESRLITNTTDLRNYAEDYGHIYHRAPRAAFVPQDAEEIAVLMRIASMFKFGPNRFQVVVRGGSGNVQGATQTDCDGPNGHQVLLDMGRFNTVTVSRKTAWVGTGSSWLNFVQSVATKGLRPTVIPDYLGITVGGFLGIGGFGADSAGVGPAIDQVLEIELVTPTGVVLRVGPNSQYFEAVRGGMGVFGIMTRVRYQLERNEANTRVYHILIPNYEAFFNAMTYFIDHYIPSKFQGFQAFAVPNDEMNLEIFVAPKADLDLVRPAVDQALAQNQTFTYYLELATRGPNALTKAQVAAILPPGVNPDLIFVTDYSTPDWDNRLKLTTVPVLVATGSWYARHPWGSYFFPHSSRNVFKNVVENLDPLVDLGFGLLAIYPYATDTFSTNSFLSVPRSDDYFYLVTLGRTDPFGTQASLDYMGQDNRDIWNQFVAAGDAGVYPTFYIPDFGPSDWQQHFGSAQWQDFLRTKKFFDPLYLLADQRNFGFDAIY